MFRQLVSNVSRSSLSCTHLHKRAFHSPFTVLSRSSASPSKSTPTSHADTAEAAAYEKQADARPDPIGLAGARTYVVDAPDPAHAPYAVPSGAYPVAAPFAH
ncbi:hypothetical protein EW145_g3373 [Phellinidium pouzarii]|uniref:Uncharacterized protein n=1 Tax=Phellinidium pouzarii TaxID=167371 RepID=A0A4V3XCW5_9AGAM|nr:hypothetical protein EW145_g3373 [Phellinidium pouzarii]